MADTYPLTPNRIVGITPEFKTTIIKFEGPYEQRLANWPNSLTGFRLYHQALTLSELQLLEDHFKDRQGAYLKFYFVNHIDGQTYEVRFKTDRLQIEPINARFFNVTTELVIC